MRGINLSNNEISVGIKGMGYYVPERILTNEELEKTIDTTDEWIREKIGIKERHICTPEQAASDLGIEAANRALKNAGVKAEDIDLIIMTTLQPDHIDPLPCSLIQYRLGAINAAAFNMSIGGCPDSLFSFITAANYIISGTYKNVLLINSEVNSKLINWKDRTMCVFFGDGAGAWVLQPAKKGKGLLGFVLGNDGSKYDVILAEGGGSRMPYTKEVLEKGLHYPHMDGKKVYEFATTVFPESVTSVLKEVNISKEKVKLFLSHQANINIITKSLEKLGVDKNKTYTNIHKYGNLSSASLPVVLAEALEKNLITGGDIITLTAFGAGLAWGSAVIKWANKEDFLV